MNRLARFFQRNVQILLVIAALLIAARVALPYAVKWYVNKTLDEMPEYDGRIGDVDMKLWRGAYEIESIDIVKTGGDVPVPFFSSKRVQFSVEWKALFAGALVGEMILQSPIINLVNGPTPETTVVGIDKPWLELIKKLFPLDINRFEVIDGSLHYRDFYSRPKVNLEIDRIALLGTNFTNSRKLSKILVANIDMTGRAFRQSDLRLTAKVDPSTERPTFDLNFKMQPVALTALNDFTRAYAKFDFEKGTLEVAAEIAVADGNLTGYIKPLFDGVAVIDLKENIQNPLKLVWEGAMGGLLRLFRNQPQNRFATKIPLSGSFDNPQASIFPTLGNILKNAFVRAFQSNIEDIIELGDAQAEPEPKKRDEKKSNDSERPSAPHGGRP